MAFGTHKVFQGFSDEDKYFGCTKRQWIILLGGVALTLPIIKTTFSLGIPPVGIFSFLLVEIICIGIAFIPIPPDKYLWGAGNKMENIIFRIILKKLPFNRVIYIKQTKKGI